MTVGKSAKSHLVLNCSCPQLNCSSSLFPLNNDFLIKRRITICLDSAHFHIFATFEISNGKLPAWVCDCPYRKLGSFFLPIYKMERAFKLDEMFTIKIPKVKTTNLLQKLHYNSIMFVHAVTGKFWSKFILISSEASQLSC